MHPIDFLRLVADFTEVCPYLPEQISRMPLSVPAGPLAPEQLDQLLEAGYRRSGRFFYHTRCPQCSACEPLRVEVDRFRTSRSQRRAQKLGDARLRTQIAPLSIDSRRVELFNRHRQERQLSQGDTLVEESDYRDFLGNSPTETAELSLWYDEKLIAVSVFDLGAASLSAVYCFFDPDFSWLSPGTYAILQQFAAARQRGLRWLYLGMMVADNAHLNYKLNYRPHQRRINGQWIEFD